jgi:hypothetical protein
LSRGTVVEFVVVETECDYGARIQLERRRGDGKTGTDETDAKPLRGSRDKEGGF